MKTQHSLKHDKRTILSQIMMEMETIKLLMQEDKIGLVMCPMKVIFPSSYSNEMTCLES